MSSDDMEGWTVMSQLKPHHTFNWPFTCVVDGVPEQLGPLADWRAADDLLELHLRH